METENLPVSWTTDAGLMTITLDRAPANALGLPLIEGLNAALDDAMDSDVRVIIITSAIEGFFAAGADIKLMATVDMTGFIAYGDALRATLNRIEESGAITIAAVDGLALGGGLELALACTFRVAGDGARFGLPEVKLGLIPGAGGTQRLPRLVGRGPAIDMILTARQVDTQEAQRMGLVDRVTPAGGAYQEARELAASLIPSSRLAQLAALRAVAVAGTPDGHLVERDEVGTLFAGPHGQEGIAAFLQKRRPDFA